MEEKRRSDSTSGDRDRSRGRHRERDDRHRQQAFQHRPTSSPLNVERGSPKPKSSAGERSSSGNRRFSGGSRDERRRSDSRSGVSTDKDRSRSRSRSRGSHRERDDHHRQQSTSSPPNVERGSRKQKSSSGKESSSGKRRFSGGNRDERRRSDSRSGVSTDKDRSRSRSRGSHRERDGHHRQQSTSSPPNLERGSPKRKSSAGKESSSGKRRFSGGNRDERRRSDSRSGDRDRSRSRGRESPRERDDHHRQQPFQHRSSSRLTNVDHGSPKRKSSAGMESSSGKRRFSGGNRGLFAKIKLLESSKGASQSSDAKKNQIMERPDGSGVDAIRNVDILVNHFLISLDPDQTIYCYRIDIKPEVELPEDHPVDNKRLVVDKHFSEFNVAYDGDKLVYSVVELPTENLIVELSPQEDLKCHTYTVQVSMQKMYQLKKYLREKENQLHIPREVLQGLDVVMKENPRKCMLSIGKNFYSKSRISLNNGLEKSEGFRHCLKPTSQGIALCLDYSAFTVRKQVCVLQFLKEHINLDIVRSDSFRWRRRDIEMALKGLRVTVTHRRTDQQYIISGLTDQNASNISFTFNGRDTTIRSYFKERYPDQHIENWNIPCLSLGKGKRENYVPIEVCVLVEDQRVPMKILPKNRKDEICEMLRSDDGPTGGKISKNFGIDVAREMTQVKGRVIEPPTLKLRSVQNEVCSFDVKKKHYHWNFNDNRVVEGKFLKHWAVLDFSFGERPTDRLKYDFLEKLVARCQKLGLSMNPHLFVEQASMDSLKNVESVTTRLEKVQSNALKKGCPNLQLILCVMTRKHYGYKYIKWISETKIGVVTQCCLSKMANKEKDQYLANLGMKINGKLGGSNVELFYQLPLFDKDADRVMLVGADVNHPRPLDFSSPSIAAVVASMNWPAANKYVPRISTQGHCVEKIEGFGRICLQLIECYEKVNGYKPKKLVIFRDGVSEEQFSMVLNIELFDLLKTLEEIKYHPTITLIVARKRHQTRLFPKTVRDGDRNGNISPGTVVDTTIVHPWEFDFYLCSHNGSIGTSKPTHYQVLWDENGFTSDQLQKFIYDLCFTFARCCKPVSLVPPVYYADLVAYRGRLHYDAQFEKASSSSATSSSTSASLSIENALHTEIRNTMYFI